MAVNERRFISLNFSYMAQHGVILLLVGPLVPEMMQSFGIREGEAGIILAAGSLGFMCCSLLAGLIIDNWGTKIAVSIGFALELLFLVLFGVSPTFYIAIAANFLMHFGAGFIENSSNVMPTLLRRKNAGAVMSMVHMFFGVGAFIGPFLIGLYLDATGGWRPVFFFAMVPTAVLLVFNLFTRFPPKPISYGERSKFFANIVPVLKSRTAILGALTLALYVGAEVGISSWLVHYLQKQLGFNKLSSSAGLSLLWIFIMIGRFLISRLAHRYSSKALVTGSSILGAAAVVVFIFVRVPFLVYPLIALIGIGLAGIFPVVMAELNNREPERTGTVTALMTMGAGFGAFIFQWLVGVTAEHVSLMVALAIPAILQLLQMLSFYAALGKEGLRLGQ